MKAFWKAVLACIAGQAVIFVVILCYLLLRPSPEWFIVTDVESYGVIDGNNDNARAEEAFSAIFPAKIEDSFQDVTYSYKAINIDSCDFEMYLEFSLEDSETFLEYVNKIAPAEEWKPFAYDETYLEYTYSDWYDADPGLSEEYFRIGCAYIAKVLIHPNEQRVITVALGVLDGGGAKTDYFTCFFDRFNIDPLEYAERPDYNHQDILNGEYRAEEWYTATALESYGIIEGSNTNDKARELFAAIFPPRIEDTFSDVTYNYTAGNIDTYDFEIFLEFTIADKAEFQKYMNGIAPTEEWLPFEYDEKYLEYAYSDWYDVDPGYKDRYAIERAEIAKVLINPEEQRIITVALGVHDGGGARTDDLSYFFNRFHIDPVAYAERPDYDHRDILYGEYRAAERNGLLPE